MLGRVLKAWWIILLSVSVALESAQDLSWIEAYIKINWGLLGMEAIGIVFIVWFGYGLYKLHPGIMGFGLFRLVSILLGNKPKYDEGTPEMEGGNINLMGTNIKYVGIVIYLLLLTALPRWAAIEEEWFRQGTVDWWDGVIRSLAFGFVHMLVGAPVAGAVAISVVGLFFTQMYFMGGVELSTQAHFQYNLIIISLLLLAAIGKSFAKD